MPSSENQYNQQNQKWKPKYSFDLLQIGEEMFIPGKTRNIASSASTWGTRYGIWLKVRACEGGAKVSRLERPVERNRVLPPDRKRLRYVEDQLLELKDALRAITSLILRVQETLNDHYESSIHH